MSPRKIEGSGGGTLFPSALRTYIGSPSRPTVESNARCRRREPTTIEKVVVLPRVGPSSPTISRGYRDDPFYNRRPQNGSWSCVCASPFRMPSPAQATGVVRGDRPAPPRQAVGDRWNVESPPVLASGSSARPLLSASVAQTESPRLCMSDRLPFAS